MEEINSASQDAVNGLPSRRPVIEMTIPSVLDKTISPPGTQFRHPFICILLDPFLLLLILIISFYFMIIHFKNFIVFIYKIFLLCTTITLFCNVSCASLSCSYANHGEILEIYHFQDLK